MASQQPQQLVIRHCAFCLEALTEVKLCGGCKKRAYCSKDCQAKDWKINGQGQSHKIWCKQGCCEEDLDWRVETVPDKGLGVVALKDIQPLAKIMVDRGYTRDELVNRPQAMDLEPKGGSLDAKVHLNQLGCGTGTVNVVALRVSRINHDCLPNAVHLWEESTKTKVVHARRLVKAGEEISISYTGFFVAGPINPPITKEVHCLKLRIAWNIVCPSNCPCNDNDLWKEIEAASSLDEKIVNLGRQGKPELALRAAKQLLQLYDDKGVVDPDIRMRTLYDAFQVAIQKKSTLNEAVGFARKAFDLMSKAFYPESSGALRFKNLMENPNSHYAHPSHGLH